MRTLLDRLTGKAKAELDKAEKHYPMAVANVKKFLKAKNYWSDLTVNEAVTFVGFISKEPLTVDLLDNQFEKA